MKENGRANTLQGSSFSEISGENTESNKQNKIEPKTGNYIMSKQLQRSHLATSGPVMVQTCSCFNPLYCGHWEAISLFLVRKMKLFLSIFMDFSSCPREYRDNLITQKRALSSIFTDYKL